MSTPIVWAPILASLNAATVSGGLAQTRARIVSHLTTTGAAYDKAVAAGEAATAEHDAAVAAATAAYADAFAVADRCARYAHSLAGQTLQPLAGGTDEAGYQALKARIVDARALTKYETVIQLALNDTGDALREAHSAMVAPTPQIGGYDSYRAGQLQAALDRASEFLALLAFT